MPSEGTPQEIITECSIQRKRKIQKTIELKKEVTERQRQGERTGRRVKFEEVFPIHEVHRADLEERTFHMDDPLGWAVLDCDAAKSFAGGDPAAV